MNHCSGIALVRPEKSGFNGLFRTAGQKKEDAGMSRAGKVRGSSTASLARRHFGMTKRNIFGMAAVALLLVGFAPGRGLAEADCLACHADKGLQDAAGHNISVDGETFAQSIHGSLKCTECHADIKDYPHPEKIAKVKCDTCHAGQASELAGSVHSNAAEHPCTSCHGDAHAVFAKDDKRSAVYPLNVPKTCGACHGNNGMAEKHGLADVFPSYLDSIHGSALTKEG